jgi:phage gpG-like protein
MATNGFKVFQRQARALIKTFPKMIGKYALLEASDNFRRGGFEDEGGGLVPWAPRKNQKEHGRRRHDGGRDRRYKNPRQRALLVQTGRLRRSPRIVDTTATSVTIGSDVPYAQGLQEGRGNMPARPFLTMGPSTRAKIIRKAAADITKLLG